MINRLFLIVIILTLACSCVPKSKIYYLQDLERNGLEVETDNKYDFNIKPDDLLRIVVTSRNMNAVQDFNKLITPTLQNETTIGGQQQFFGYLTDDNGYIDFPVLGMLKVSDFSISELTQYLKNEISKYVKEPVFVDVRVLNVKITVLGEVNAPGTYNLNSNRTTVLQALGMAGDLTIYGDRKTVTLLREESGKRKSYLIDLTSSKILEEDFYFLQQNDILIVNPNTAQVQSAGFNRNAPLFVSIASLLISIIVILSRN